MELLVDPWEDIKKSFDHMWKSGDDAWSKFKGLDFSGGATAALGIPQGAVQIIDLLSLYLYLINQIITNVVGSIFPVAGNAAATTISQWIDTILSVLSKVVNGLVAVIKTVQNAQKIAELLQKKFGELDDDAENENTEDEIPFVEFTEEEADTLANAAAPIIGLVMPPVIGLVMSVLGNIAGSIAKNLTAKVLQSGQSKAKEAIKSKCRICEACFPAGTLVDTAEGLRPIETLGSGTGVWSRHTLTGEWGIAVVAEHHRVDYVGQLVRLTTAAGEVVATENHPFWVVSGEGLAVRPLVEEAWGDPASGILGRWVAAGDVRVGDVLVGRTAGLVVVDAVETWAWSGTTYNLRVPSQSTYTVGVGGLWVHNAKSTGRTPQKRSNKQSATPEKKPRKKCDPCKRKRKLPVSSKCNVCYRTKAIPPKSITGRNGNKFTAKVAIGVNSKNEPYKYSDVGIKKETPEIAGEPVVCRVYSLSGDLKPRPPALGKDKETRSRNTMSQLLLFSASRGYRGNENPLINTSDYQAGHLIGEGIGGPDSVYALVPMDKKLNGAEAWYRMEQAISDCLYQNNITGATMTVKVTYGDSGSKRFVPSRFDVKVVFRQKNGINTVTGGPELWFNNSDGDGRSFAGINHASDDAKIHERSHKCLTRWMPD